MSQVARDQPLGAAQAGDLGQGVLVLEGLDPEAREAGADVLREALGERHGGLLGGDGIGVSGSGRGWIAGRDQVD